MNAMKIMDVHAAAKGRPGPFEGRLGLNVPANHWPTAAALKGYEAAGFDWAQLHSPPRQVLEDDGLAHRHAEALAAVLAPTSLRRVIHAPDDLLAGAPTHDRAFVGLVDYAGTVGAELVVYHGRNIPPGAAAAERATAEEHALRAMLPRLQEAGLTLAIENLAPVYPGSARLSYSPRIVAELVERLDSPQVGMCFDIGHANITAGARNHTVAELLAPLADRVVLFHVHDNLGDRRRGRLPGVDPVRLDLHLPPGIGTVPWEALTPLLATHSAPLQLEVHAPHRPVGANGPASLAAVTLGVFGTRAARAAPRP